MLCFVHDILEYFYQQYSRKSTLYTVSKNSISSIGWTNTRHVKTKWSTIKPHTKSPGILLRTYLNVTVYIRIMKRYILFEFQGIWNNWTNIYKMRHLSLELQVAVEIPKKYLSSYTVISCGGPTRKKVNVYSLNTLLLEMIEELY